MYSLLQPLSIFATISVHCYFHAHTKKNRKDEQQRPSRVVTSFSTGVGCCKVHRRRGATAPCRSARARQRRASRALVGAGGDFFCSYMHDD